ALVEWSGRGLGMMKQNYRSVRAGLLILRTVRYFNLAVRARAFSKPTTPLSPAATAPHPFWNRTFTSQSSASHSASAARSAPLRFALTAIMVRKSPYVLTRAIGNGAVGIR